MTSKRRLFVFLVPVLLVAGGLTAANAQSEPGERLHEMEERLRAMEGDRLLPPQATLTTTYVPVTPCRIVDTRVGGGKMGVNQTREFYVAGTANFPAQGGKSGGCGVPKHASSIAATVTAVAPEGTGFMRAWPIGAAAPTATMLNFERSTGGVGTGATVTIKPWTVTSAPGLNIRNFGAPSHLVVDVTGYYTSPIWATVNTAGNVVYSSGSTIGSTRPAVGVYEITFDSTISGCATIATSSSNLFHAAAYVTSNTGVRVVVRDLENAALAYSGFSLLVTC